MPNITTIIKHCSKIVIINLYVVCIACMIGDGSTIVMRCAGRKTVGYLLPSYLAALQLCLSSQGRDLSRPRQVIQASWVGI